MIGLNTVMYNLYFSGMLSKLYADIVIIVGLFIYSFCSFRKRIWEVILKYMGGMLLAAVIEIEAIFLVSFVEKMVDMPAFIALVNSIIMFGIACFINHFYYVMSKKVYYTVKDKIIVSVKFVCIVLMCRLIVDFVIFRRLHQALDAVMFLGVTIVYCLLSVLKKNRWELEIKNSEMEMYQLYDRHYKELVKEVRRKQHDYKNQLATIYSMKQRMENVEQFVRYTDEVADKFKYEKLLTYCNNSVLSGFLYHKCLAFEKAGIHVQFEINVDKAECVMLLHEMIETLGILLDNACEYLQENRQYLPCIFLKVKEEQERLCLEVKNQSAYMSCDKIEKIFQEGYSTKGRDRGIGLYRIRQLTDRYHAELIVQNENYENANWISFRIAIAK